MEPRQDQRMPRGEGRLTDEVLREKLRQAPPPLVFGKKRQAPAARQIHTGLR